MDDDLASVRAAAVRQCLAAGASPEEAEDAVHEAFLAGLEASGSKWRHPGWLRTVAGRRRVDLIRRNRRERRSRAVQDAASDRTETSPEEAVADAELANWLVESLSELPPVTQAVCKAIGDGLTPAEVAQALDVSFRSVESHLTRARRYLRRLGQLGVPFGLAGWLTRHATGAQATAASALVVPVGAATVMLLPGETPGRGPAEAPPSSATPHLAAPVHDRADRAYPAKLDAVAEVALGVLPSPADLEQDQQSQERTPQKQAAAPECEHDVRLSDGTCPPTEIVDQPEAGLPVRLPHTAVPATLGPPVGLNVDSTAPDAIPHDATDAAELAGEAIEQTTGSTEGGGLADELFPNGSSSPTPSSGASDRPSTGLLDTPIG